MVQYQVQFKPIHPVSNNPITNNSEFSGVGSYSTSTDYDSILMYTRTSWPAGDDLYRFNGWIPSGNIQKIPYKTWCIYSIVDSVKEAMIVAKPLIQEYGVDNVQICKVVPTSTQIVFEEEA